MRLYEHDCDDCIYQGTKDYKDYYEHDGIIIVRYSSEPSDNATYQSDYLPEWVRSDISEMVF